jgi:hypothetical protein
MLNGELITLQQQQHYVNAGKFPLPTAAARSCLRQEAACDFLRGTYQPVSSALQLTHHCQPRPHSQLALVVTSNTAHMQ